MVVPPRIKDTSAEALFRYQVVAQVEASIGRGTKQLEAIRAAARQPHLTFDGTLRHVGKRTIYRWLAAYRKHGLAGLEPARRERTQGSLVLPDELLEFVGQQKDLDPAVSIPELIRRARELGIVDATTPIDRSTLYRAAKRMEIPVARRKGPVERDARRFAYPHRLECVLCDGKHFRAGAQRAKRVALFFIDDATRKGLGVVVGTSENPGLFLRGLYELVCRYGLMQIVYLDRGPGFRAADCFEVVGKLGGLLILGEKAYPEGHGKIERFNQTAKAQVLRGLDHRPDVDPACGALELRLSHYLFEQYDHTPHEGLDLRTPAEVFEADAKPLSFPESDADLRRRFVVHLERTATKDHIVSIDGTAYEVPRGLAQRRLSIHHRLLDGTYAVADPSGTLVDLHPVDLAANARSRRGRSVAVREDQVTTPLPKSAADISFDRDFRPVVTEDGGFSDPTD